MARSIIPTILRARRLDCEDPYAAPGLGRGEHPARPFTFRRAVQNMLAIYAFGLIFLLLAFFNLGEGDPSRGVLVLRFLLVCLIGLAYLGSAWAADLSLAGRIGYILAFVGLLALTATIWGWSWINYGVYVSVMIAMLIPWRYSRFVLLGWSLAMLLTVFANEDLTPVYIAIVGAAVGLATGGGMEAGRIGAALNRAEHRVSTLAVAAERERIARDLHDILGHSLTAVSIKSGLAGRLVDVDPDAAKAQIAEVEQIARQALADVRATASGMREVRVASEIAGARSVLLAAGIGADTPSAIPTLVAGRSELFGFVIREAVTNVVRHSEATRCTITITPDQVVVTDDGRGRADLGRGSGLVGLRERLEAAGGSLVVDTTPRAGTVVTATLPPDAPTAAAPTDVRAEVSASQPGDA